jgi:5-methylcytosine-specific restriction endonuclease McrA
MNRWKKPELILGTEKLILRSDNSKKKHTVAKYRCCCGKIFETGISRVETNRTKSCGCKYSEKSRTFWDYKDNYEKNMGLMLVKIVGVSEKWHMSIGEFICHCGTSFETAVISVRTGATRSCGKCLQRWETAPYHGEVITKINKEDFKKVFKEKIIYSARGKKEITISLKYTKKLMEQNCFYCGRPPQKLHFFNKKNKKPYLFNGIDRRDNNKGYTEENCVSCCSPCNFLKGTMGEKEFLQYTKKIYEYRITNNDAHSTGKVLPVRDNTRALKESNRSRQEQTRRT